MKGLLSYWILGRQVRHILTWAAASTGVVGAHAPGCPLWPGLASPATQRRTEVAMSMPAGLQKEHSLWPAVAVAGQQAWLSARLPLAWSLCVQEAQPHGLEEKVQP